MTKEQQPPNNLMDPEVTRVSPGLSDAEGNQVSAEELKKLMEIPTGNTVAQLTNMSTIGMGGIGVVFSAHEPVLNREIAIKVLRPAYRDRLNFVSDFIREARITAQIDHPNVIPVHRLGVFDDAGVYFTMKRVDGVNLSYILRELHDGSEEMRSRYSRSRLLEIFISICNGVAFAHSKGIIHRDLKPGNILIGDYGEVFIADWGLALYREDHDRSHQARKIELGELPDSGAPPGKVGEERSKVSGTPAFMAPEQLAGSNSELDEQTDVYALGAILYSILTWEPSPYPSGLPLEQLMKLVAQQRFLRPRRRAPRRKIPYELEAICLKAMAAKKNKRYLSVRDLLRDVRNYLDNFPVTAYTPHIWYRFYKLIRRRPLVPLTLLAAGLTLGIWTGGEKLQHTLESRSLLRVADNSLAESNNARNQALAAHSQLNRYYAATGSTNTIGQAAELRIRFNRARDEYEIASNNAWELLIQIARLNGNLKLAGPLMAKMLHDQIDFAVATDNAVMLNRIVTRLQHQTPAVRKQLYNAAPSLENQLALLRHNHGELFLNTRKTGLPAVATRMAAAAPPGRLARQRNAPGAETASAQTLTPLAPPPRKTSLEAGEYRIDLPLPAAPEQTARTLQFPVTIRSGATETIDLDLPDFWPEDMVFIPGGSFIFGNRTFDDQSARTRLKSFFIGRHEVTFAQYLEFWKTLSPQLKRRYRGRVVSPNPRQDGGTYHLWDDQGNLRPPLRPDMPVIGISGEAAEAYCRYRSQKTNLRYRLPTLLEWEKAARGVDGREYLWGSAYRSGKANIRETDSTPEGTGGALAVCGSYPEDVSVYGVNDMAGNVREIVRNPGNEPYFNVKGASFYTPPRFARIPETHEIFQGLPDVGFRCVVEIPEAAESGKAAGAGDAHDSAPDAPVLF